MKQLIITGVFLIGLLSIHLNTFAYSTDGLKTVETSTVSNVQNNNVDMEMENTERKNAKDIEEEHGKIELEKVKSYVTSKKQFITKNYDKWIYIILGLFILAAYLNKYIKKDIDNNSEKLILFITQIVVFAAACIIQTIFVRYGFNGFSHCVMGGADFTSMLGFLGMGVAMVILPILECFGMYNVLNNIGDYAGIRKNYIISILIWVLGIIAVLAASSLKPIKIPVIIYSCIGLIAIDLLVAIIQGRKNLLWLFISLLMYIICLFTAIQFFTYAFLLAFWVMITILVVVIFLNFTTVCGYSVQVVDGLGKVIGRMTVQAKGAIVSGFRKINDDKYEITDKDYMDKIQ